MSRSLRLHRLALLSLVAAGSLACRTPSSKIPLDELNGDARAGNEGHARESVDPLPVERPTDMLSTDVTVVVEALDPAAVLGLIGPLDKYPNFDVGRQMLRSWLGGDILNADEWAALGLDSHGAVGLGLIDIDAFAMFAYVTLSDEVAFEKTLERLVRALDPERRLDAGRVGNARIIRVMPELSVVVRERIAMFVVTGRPDQTTRDHVVTAATIDPRESLGHSERFVWARAQLQDRDDGMLYVDLARVFEQTERRDARFDSDYGIRYAEEELERARKSGDAELIRELEGRVEEERRWQQQREAQRAGQRDFNQAMFGPNATLMGAADLRSDGIVAHGRLLIPGEGLLRRLFLAVERESPLLTALAEPPVLAIDGRVEMGALLELAELVARVAGKTMTEVNDELRSETGIDALGSSRALTGDGGLVLTELRKPDPRRPQDARKALGLAAYLGLRDAAAIRKALDSVVRTKQFGGALVQAKRGDGWVLHVPKWHDVEIAIVGDRLVFGTDAKLPARIRDAERGSQASELATPEHPLRGPLPNPALRTYGRWSGIVIADAHAPWEQDAESMLYDINTHHLLSPDEAAKVPRSREFKRKLAELEKAVADLNEHDRRRAVARFERELAFMDRLGDVGVQIEPLADGLGIQAQWRFAPGMTPLEIGYRWFEIDEHDWSEYATLSNRAYDLSHELRQIRQADLDAAAAGRKP